MVISWKICASLISVCSMSRLWPLIGLSRLIRRCNSSSRKSVRCRTGLGISSLSTVSCWRNFLIMYPRKKKYKLALWKQNATPEKPSPQRQIRLDYVRLLPQWKSEHPVCDYPGCTSRHVDAHHTHGKSGTLLIYWPWIIPLCFPHHRFSHDRIEEARAIIGKSGLPLICAKGEWNQKPRNDL